MAHCTTEPGQQQHAATRKTIVYESAEVRVWRIHFIYCTIRSAFPHQPPHNHSAQHSATQPVFPVSSDVQTHHLGRTAHFQIFVKLAPQHGVWVHPIRRSIVRRPHTAALRRVLTPPARTRVVGATIGAEKKGGEGRVHT